MTEESTIPQEEFADPTFTPHHLRIGDQNLALPKALARALEDEDIVAAELSRRVQKTAGFSSLQCAFDGSKHDSMEENLIYMAKHFGFFVPYVEQLENADAMLTYLGQKVGVAYACIACDSAFGDIATTQSHMIDSQHCHLTCDEELMREEYCDFYLFDERESCAEEEDGSNNNEDDMDSEIGQGNERRESPKSEYPDKGRNGLPARLQIPRTPSVRKNIRKGRKTAWDRRNASVVMEKSSAAVRSPVVRQAALLMMGGPAVAAVKGAPLAIAGGKACYEAAENALDAASEKKNSSVSVEHAEGQRSNPMLGVSDRVMKGYRSLGWNGPVRLAAKRRRQITTGSCMQLIVGGRTRYTTKARFKHSMSMYNHGRNF